MNRRLFIKGFLVLMVAGVFIKSALAGTEPIRTKIRKIRKTRREWKTLLTPKQYQVLRREGTEAPFSSSLLRIKEKGVYACAGCDLPLFTSETKYNSGTGWPSFYSFIPGRILTKLDFSILIPRTEYHCARCEGHQGHLFKDGPPPTYKRYCNNGVALKFVPASKTRIPIS